MGEGSYLSVAEGPDTNQVPEMNGMATTRWTYYFRERILYALSAARWCEQRRVMLIFDQNVIFM